MTAKLKRSLWITAGCISLAAAIIGIILPLIPGTPFLLLSAYCFDRGSQKFHQWLIHHRYLGPPIRDWQRRHIIRTQNKILASVMILATSAFVLSKPTIPLIGKALYGVTICSVLIFIWTRNSH